MPTDYVLGTQFILHIDSMWFVDFALLYHS